MAIAIGRTSVSQRLAARFAYLAGLAQHSGNARLALTRLLTAAKHDTTPGSRIELANFLVATGDSDRAFDEFERAYDIARSSRNSADLASCARGLALLHRDRREFVRAKQFLQSAAAAEMSAWSNNESSLSSSQLYCESLLAMDERDFARSRALCRAALVSATGGDRSRIYRQLARLDRLDGQRETAARHLLSAAQVARQHGGHRQYAECILELGHLLRSLGRLKTAIDCYRVAFIRFDRAGSPVQAHVARRWLYQTRGFSRLSGQHCELN